MDDEDSATARRLEQLNTAMAVRISDSNLKDFADAGVFVHPMSANALVAHCAALMEHPRPDGPRAPRSEARV